MQEKRENLKLEGNFEFPAGKAVYCKSVWIGLHSGYSTSESFLALGRPTFAVLALTLIFVLTDRNSRINGAFCVYVHIYCIPAKHFEKSYLPIDELEDAPLSEIHVDGQGPFVLPLVSVELAEGAEEGVVDIPLQILPAHKEEGVKDKRRHMNK